MRIILIIYANDPHQKLSFLEKESKAIQQVLNSFRDRAYEVKILPAASPQDLLEELKVHGEKVEILHYSGHANGNELALNEQEAEGTHLAEVLKAHCPNLKLLFLNGCNTKDQVAAYHKATIPYVVATSAPVKDEESFLLAREFYTYLVNGKSAITAFEALKSGFRLLKKDMELNVHRGLVLQKSKNELEWNLYILGNSAAYQLPKKIEQQNPIVHKNSVQNSELKAGGNIHVGDKNITQNAERIYNIERIDKADFS